MGDQSDTMSLATKHNRNVAETQTYTNAWNTIRKHDPNILESKNQATN